MELPHLPFHSFVLGACLSGCGGGDATVTPSPDASSDPSEDHGQAVGEAAAGSDAAGGTMRQGPVYGRIGRVHRRQVRRADALIRPTTGLRIGVSALYGARRLNAPR